MICKLKVRFFDAYDSSHTCFITVSPTLYSRYFLNEESISYQTLSTLVSSGTLARLKPLFWPRVIHQDDGTSQVFQMYHFKVLSIKSLY